MKPRLAVLHCLLFVIATANLGRAQSHGYTIQTSSKTSEVEARAEVAQLVAAGFAAHWVKADVPGKGTRYRVRFGRFGNLADAKAKAEQARQRGVISEYIVTGYETPAAAAVKPAPKPPAETVAATPVTEEAKPKPTPKPKVEKPVTKPSEDLAKAAPASVKATPPVEAPPKPEPPKPEPPKVEPKLEPKPTPKKTDEPKAAEPEPDKVNPGARIAEPPMADALADFDITNKNWKVVRRSNASDKNLQTLFFVDSMTGWVAGDAGAVYRTTDGGKSWKPLLSGAAANLTQLQFVDWNTGWMLGELARKDDAEVETVLLLTTNGGRSWTKKAVPNVLSFWFTDARQGWAVGKNATLWQTTDGGNEWQPYGDAEKLIGLPVESSNYNFGFREVHFLDARHGWLIGNFYGRAQTNIGGLFATSDGGQTWRRVSFTMQTKAASGRFTPGLLHSVRFTDVNTGTLTGEMMDGEARFFFALHTRDGGQHWEQYRTPSRAAHSTQFLDPALGWTAAAARREGGADATVFDTLLMRTDNGGASWRNDFVARGQRIRSVFFLSPTRGWAVGDRGMILRYEERPKTN